MSISGGIKFFGENACLLDGGGSIVASTGTAAQDNAIDKNPLSFWTSVGSDDSTVETLTLTFGTASINRLILQDINWKQFTVQYWNGSTWVNFTSVYGLDSTTGASSISETAFADNTAYYEFATVSTTKLKITVTKTQVVDQEKYIAGIMAFSELGTLQGYPTVDNTTLDRHSRTMTMLSGRSKIVKSNQVFSVSLTFESYPTSKGADLDLIMSLFDRESPFHIWLCGGRRGTTYFRYTLRGWRLKDCVRVQTDSVITGTYSGNIYTAGLNFGISFSEIT